MIRKKRNAGFTVVETVVLVGIIIVLAGLVTGILVRVKETSKSVICLNNLKQIAAAIQMYRSEQKVMPPALYPALLPYVKDAKVFKCPADHTGGLSSYDPFYIARVLTDSGKLFLGCPRHNDKALAVFGWPQFNIGKAGKVLWNGSPQSQGTVVQGGTLLFEDGTKVVIDGATKVGVMLSCTDPNNHLYSAVCIQEGDQGNLTVTHPTTSDSQFEVLTPSLITGVAGTAFTLQARWPDNVNLSNFSTLVKCTEGSIYVEDRATGKIIIISADKPPGEIKISNPIPSIVPIASKPGKPPKPPRIPKGKAWGYWEKED